jgi:hypothetical protein
MTENITVDLILLLQLWGGIFFLLNKIFFTSAEYKVADRQRLARLRGWIFYFIGIWSWMILFGIKGNYIMLGVEAGSIPMMIVGIHKQSKAKSFLFLNKIALFFSPIQNYILTICIAVGIFYSFYSFEANGDNVKRTIQILELVCTLTFLIGTRLMNTEKYIKWGLLCFMLMNVSAGSFLFLQENEILGTQQAISLLIVGVGAIKAFTGFDMFKNFNFKRTST